MLFEVYVDGSSENPGKSASVAIMYTDGVEIGGKITHREKGTNNEAEYDAILNGLYLIKQYAKKGDVVRLYSDSELAVSQIYGEYVVRSESLKRLFREIINKMSELKEKGLQIDIIYISRTKNKMANKMARDELKKLRRLTQWIENRKEN